jgi:hypothetical protein
MGYLFNVGSLGLQNGGGINWGSDAIRARLSRTSETPDPDATSMSGLGIAGFDVTLAGKTGPVTDAALNRTVYSAASPVFPLVSIGPELDKIIVFKFSVNDAGSTPIVVANIVPITPFGGDIGTPIPGTGLFYLQNAP